MRRNIVRLGTVLLIFLTLSVSVAYAAGPVVLTVYYSPECSHCADFEAEVLPRLEAEFGDSLAVAMVDMTTSDGLASLEDAEARLGTTAEYLPVLVVDGQLFSNEDPFALEEPIHAAIAAAIAGGGTAAEGTPTVAAEQAPAAATNAPALNVAYVAREGCSECARVSVTLDVMKGEFPNLVVTQFDHVADADVVEAMGKALGLPADRRLIAPSLYVGRDALVDDEITSTRVRALLSDYASTGAPAFWEQLDAQQGRVGIVQRFQRMGPFAVVAAGLVDGINPCAFATIIFFVSYLAVSRRRKREMLMVGLAFVVGVFAAYLAVGLGAMQLLSLVQGVRWLGYVLYGGMALMCFVLAGISVHDYLLARKGHLHKMALNLPEDVRERIKGRIRSASNAFIGAAFVTGLLVSLMELACTGQVYLPTISFVVGLPGMRARAVLYLLAYNIMFVVPLLAVLLLTVYGISAARFQDWFVKHAALSKLIMVALFLLLGGLLLVQLLSF